MGVLELDIKQINDLVESGLIFHYYFIGDEKLIQKYLEIENIEIRRYYINNLLENNFCLYERINKKLCDMYGKIFTDGFDSYINKYREVCKRPNPDEIVKKVCSEQFCYMLVDRYFEDFSFNVFINMKNMLHFNEQNDNKIIPEERTKLYYLILHYEEFDFETEKQIYLNMPYNIKEMFYEDFRNCQNHAYKLINENIIDVSTLKSEEINGIKVYYLNGEDFVLPVHCILSMLKKENLMWNEKFALYATSISLIGTECLEIFGNTASGVVGFSHLNINDIMHMYHTDSYSQYKKSSEKVNEIFMPHELLRKTYGYNELLISQNNINSEKLIPDYVICYDDLDDTYFKFSQNLGNIPIIVINTQVYKKGKDYHQQKLVDYDEKRYIKSLPSIIFKN